MSKELVTLKDDVLEEFDFEDYKMDVEHPFLNIYDELVKYEANATVKLPWISEPVTYRDLDVLSSREKDSKKRL